MEGVGGEREACGPNKFSNPRLSRDKLQQYDMLIIIHPPVSMIQVDNLPLCILFLVFFLSVIYLRNISSPFIRFSERNRIFLFYGRKGPSIAVMFPV